MWRANAQQSVGPAEVQQAENQLTQVYQQLRGTLDEANQKKLKASEVQWIKQKETAIASSPNPDATHYQLVMQRVATLQEVMNRMGSQQPPPQLRQATPPSQIPPSQTTEGGITSQQPDRIEGINSEKEKWAYEFLDNKTSGNPSFLDSRSGAVVFQNSEWIVKATESSGNVGKIKTDLFFYDTRTLKLISTARIPNKIIKVGRVGSGTSFYVITITPMKYRYDDAPLNICLIDPKNRLIDRIKLVEDDYWFALNNPILVSAEGNTIEIRVDETAEHTGQLNVSRSGYLSGNPKNSFFKDIKITFKPGAKEYYSKNPAKVVYPNNNSSSREAIIPSQMEFDQQAKNEQASLDSLGINATGDIDGSERSLKKANAAVVSSGSLSGIHVISADENGSLHDINLACLTARSIKLAASRIELPGIFCDGTCYGVQSNTVIIHSDVTNFITIFTNSYLTFDSSNAYALPEPPDHIWWKRHVVDNISTYSIQSLNQNGDKKAIQLPDLQTSSVSKNIEGDISVAVYPEERLIYGSWLESEHDLLHVFARFSLSDGRQIGPLIKSECGKTPTVTCIRDGIAPKGWHLPTYSPTGSTGGFEYSIALQNDAENSTLDLVQGMPDLASPLEVRFKKDRIIQLIYSCAGVTKLAEYTPEGKLNETLAEWPSPPQEGKPLLLSERNLVFIPKAGGYDAYRIFGEGKPEKAFEIYFRGSSDYVILLPNGFYAGSPGCERLITLQAGDGKVDASALAPWRNRPAEVIKALGGDPKNADILAKVTERWLKRAKFDLSMPEPKASEIPKVEVNQMPPLWAQGAGITFPIEVTAGASPLTEVTVRVNGIPQQAISGSELNVPVGGKGTVQGSVTLAQGQNWIEVTATDEKGRVSNQAHFRSILPEAPEKPKRYIVAMGCSEYDRPELNLQYAAKDAGDVLKTFQEAGGRDCKTLLLTNKEVGPEALEKIKAFVGESKESDEVILFCAGHGLLDEHLDYVYAGHQIDPEHPGDTGIHLDALLDAIKAGKSLKRLVLMDTCQSGSVGEKEEMKLASASTELPHGVRAVKSRALKVVGVSPMTGGDQQRFIEEMFLLPGQHRGINIIGASGGAEYAMESDKWNNGVFTSALIEALRDKKADMDHRGRISVSDLKTYLGQRVPELTGGAQKPSVVAFEQDQDFDLVGDMPPIPESVKKQGVATTSEAPLPVTPLSVASESTQMTPPNLGAQFVNSLGQKFVPIPGTPAYFCIWDTRVSDYGQFVKETGRAWKPA